MARKAVATEEVVETVEEVVEQPVVEEVKKVDPVDIDALFAKAKEQIEICEDYIQVPGADFKGKMKNALVDWRKFKYQLRQYKAGLITEVPVMPDLVTDY